MRLQLFVCLLLVAFVCALNAQPPAAPPPPANGAPGAETPAKAPEPPKVNPTDPVITIKGLCQDSSQQSDACKTVITKEQFEKIADTLQPGMAPPMKRQLATRYSQVLGMSTEAEKRGLDKTPHFEEAMRFARMQILAQELSKALQADSNNVSDQDIEEFYKKNAANYEQATLVKIFVPRTKRIETPPADDDDDKAEAAGKADAAKTAANQQKIEEQRKAGEEAMKKEASVLRGRLMKGDDPDTLEKDAFAAAGLQGTPPSTKMDQIRRNALPADQQTAFDLKTGEISEVISDASGNFIYKLVSKEPIPMDKVKSEIHNQLASQRYREAMQRYQSGPELNEAYFGPTRPMMPMRGRPGAPKDNDPDRE